MWGKVPVFWTVQDTHGSLNSDCNYLGAGFTRHISIFILSFLEDAEADVGPLGNCP